MPVGGDAAIGGNIAPWRAIGGVWREGNEEGENYTYAIALQNND